jgi:hypothetical protein
VNSNGRIAATVQVTPRNARKRGVFLRAQGRTAVPMRGRLPSQPSTRWSSCHEPPPQKVGRAGRAPRAPPTGVFTANVSRRAKHSSGANANIWVCHHAIARNRHGRLARPAAITARSGNSWTRRAKRPPPTPQAAVRLSARRDERASAAMQADHGAPNAVVKNVISKATAQRVGCDRVLKPKGKAENAYS